MNRKWVGIALMALGWTFVVATTGCDRSAPAPVAGGATAATSPATRPPATTTAAASRPVSSVMQVGDRPTVFPPARLRLETDGQRLVALLFSDDPRDALKDNYTGNSFYLRMELDISDADQLARATWRYTAPSAADREDSPYGIYLGGRKVQLVPFQVMGRFKTAAADVDSAGLGGGREAAGGDASKRAAPPEDANAAVTSVLISGQFQVIDDSTRRGPAQIVPVAAELPVMVESDLEQRRTPAD